MSSLQNEPSSTPSPSLVSLTSTLSATPFCGRRPHAPSPLLQAHWAAKNRTQRLFDSYVYSKRYPKPKPHLRLLGEDMFRRETPPPEDIAPETAAYRSFADTQRHNPPPFASPIPNAGRTKHIRQNFGKNFSKKHVDRGESPIFSSPITAQPGSHLDRDDELAEDYEMVEFKQAAPPWDGGRLNRGLGDGDFDFTAKPASRPQTSKKTWGSSRYSLNSAAPRNFASKFLQREGVIPKAGRK